MSLIFSTVMVTAGNRKAEFFVGGTPTGCEDLTGYLPFDAILDAVREKTEVYVHADVYCYGEGESFDATREEGVMLKKRAEADKDFLTVLCDRFGAIDFSFEWSPDENHDDTEVMKTMNGEESARALLKQKVSENYAAYKEKWLQMQPEELIERCEELEAVTRMAEVLPSASSEEYAEYLLRFKNPLEVVSDEWISRNGIDALIVDDEMSHILWRIMDYGDAESIYELEPEFTESESSTMSM